MRLLLMEEILHQFFFGKSPSIYRVSYMSGCAGFLPSWTLRHANGRRQPWLLVLSALDVQGAGDYVAVEILRHFVVWLGGCPPLPSNSHPIDTEMVNWLEWFFLRNTKHIFIWKKALHSTIYIDIHPLKNLTTALPDSYFRDLLQIWFGWFGEFVWSCCVVVFCCVGGSQNTAYEYWWCKDAPLSRANAPGLGLCWALKNGSLRWILWESYPDQLKQHNPQNKSQMCN